MDDEESALTMRARLESVAEIPAFKAWENIGVSPPADADYIEEEFLPGPPVVTSGPAEHGDVETECMYVVKVYGITDRGDSAIRAMTGGVKAMFPPGFSIRLPSGDRIRIKTNPGPWASKPLPNGRGKSRSVVSIPCIHDSINSFPSA